MIYAINTDNWGEFIIRKNKKIGNSKKLLIFSNIFRNSFKLNLLINQNLKNLLQNKKIQISFKNTSNWKKSRNLSILLIFRLFRKFNLIIFLGGIFRKNSKRNLIMIVKICGGIIFLIP